MAKKTVKFQLHEKQAEVFNCKCRFRVVVAGRRFGKSMLSMMEMLAWATKRMQKIWYVAPTYRMAKQIMWSELKSSVPMEWVSKIRENELSMELRNGSIISLRGADKPDSLRGVSLDFLVLDEFQDIQPETWNTVLRPTLADRKGHALFIGCVVGDTKVLSREGIRNIEEYSTNNTPKTLEPMNVDFYGLEHKYHKADGFWNNGVVDTKRITTKGGFGMEASLPHPIWTIDENGVQSWKCMKDLQVGDRVAIARGMEQWGCEDRDPIDATDAWNVTRERAKCFVYKELKSGAYKTEQARAYQLLLTNFGVIADVKDDTIFIPHLELEEASGADYFWDSIESIEDGNAQTYDFTIPETHSFWSNGFISHNTPKGYNGLYKLYKVGQNKLKQAKGEWMSWQFPTITSPFIPKAEIEAARRDMDEKMFRQEMLASFESMSGRVYYAFDRKDHVANVEFNPKLPIWVGVDFNIDPMSTVIFQPQTNGQLWAVDEIVQVASNTDDIMAELEKRYYKYQHQVTIYPDPAGSARQHARGESDLDIIREHGFKRIKVKRSHSAIADRVNAVNRLLRTASGDIRLFINPKCKHLIDSFEQTLYIANSRDVDKSLGVEHSADAAGYCIELEFPLRKFEPIGFSR